MKILLIDDHALMREGIALVLEKIQSGTHILEAEDARTALSMIDTHSDFDLVLLDLHLPDTEGFELLQRIKSLVPDTPIAMLSANEDAQLIQEALNLGANGFITKSSNSKVMLSAIQLILAGDIYVPKAILNKAAPLPPVNPVATSEATEPEPEPQADIHLTDRQQSVLKLMVNGLANKEIAKELGMSPSTVKVHVAAILRAFNVANRTQAVSFAQKHRLIKT